MNSSPVTLNQVLAGIPSKQKLCVALSGGMDSAVLLHSVVSARRFATVRAFHVNHQLSSNADTWQSYCESLCAKLGVSFESATVNVSNELGAGGEGLEDAARRLRYQAFEENLREGELLLLAHHADDQYETLLLRLMRGSGVRGLASIPQRRVLGRGELFRPLLTLPRQDLADYARKAGLSWLEDESNQDTRFDRNYCRHDLLPVFEKRWPNYRNALQKSMLLLAEADTLADELAQLDFNESKTDVEEELELSVLQALSTHRLRNLLRFWLMTFGIRNAGWNTLTTLSDGLQSAKSNKGEARVLLETKTYSLAVFASRLHLLPTLKPALDDGRLWNFNEGSCDLPGNGSLQLCAAGTDQNFAIDREKLDQLEVRYRRGGEKLKLPGRPTKSLKKLFQESSIAPWLRNRVPLLFSGDDLVFVPMIGVADAFAASPSTAIAQDIIWSPPNFNWPNIDKSN
ncbi:MAG: tRNA lysidine(34) synthetase TilS [Pseudohongiellaceae bacterium]